MYHSVPVFTNMYIIAFMCDIQVNTRESIVPHTVAFHTLISVLVVWYDHIHASTVHAVHSGVYIGLGPHRVQSASAAQSG